MLRDMRIRSVAVIAVALAACGASTRRPYLATKVGREQWYASPTRCSQGPFELNTAVTGNRWGEGIEVVVTTPRRVRLTAVVDVDGTEVSRRTITVGPQGIDASQRAENQACVATAIELDEATTGPTTGPTSGPTSGSGPENANVNVHVNDPGSVALIPGTRGGSAYTLIGFSWSSPGLDLPDITAGAHIRIRIWSSIPNDLQGVAFGLVQTLERPNVSDADYEAHLRAEIDVRAAEERRAAERRPTEPLRPRPAEDPRKAEIRARIEADQALERARDQAAQAEAADRRAAYCDAHHDDTGCWGPGGFAVSEDLARRAGERLRYCEQNELEARCWSTETWYDRRRVWTARIEAARQARENPPEPDGPPPARREESQPPTPSRNAEWRPGYWHWNGGDWSWIVGQWRVPESDIEQELTAKAPSQPPAPQVEEAPPPPATVAVWTPGYWSWDGRAWIWVAGSWQIPPAARLEWRPARWEVRGSVIVLVPGAWITVP
jgi:hypothetical protein